jgi:hypothetical protein
VIVIITIPTAGAILLAKVILSTEDAEDVEEAVEDVGEEETIVSILKNVECFNCGKKGHYSTDFSLPGKK